MKKLMAVFFVLIVFAFNVFAQKTEWQFDKAHTNIGFTIAHMVISDVTGRFTDFDGMLVSESDDFSGSQVNVTIKTASINTANEKRDDHLRSADFFSAEENAEITFKSKSFEKVDDKNYKISGDLSMNGVTKEVILDATFKGVAKDPWGGTRAAFKATTTLDRYDYNLKYNSVLETGGLLIGQEVDIEINLQLIKKS